MILSHTLICVAALTSCGGGADGAPAMESVAWHAANLGKEQTQGQGLPTESNASSSVVASAASSVAPNKITSAAATTGPLVFNASPSARPGQLVSLQGENFGTQPEVQLLSGDGSFVRKLPVVNRVGSGWVATRIPPDVRGAIVVRVVDGAVSSAPIKLNAATAHHLDSLEIAPGGVMRIFGRNLLVPDHEPVVMISGVRAVVDSNASDEHMLTVTVPLGLQATAKAAITVDNGNGSGASLLPREIAIAEQPPGNPFNLPVAWASAFTPVAQVVVNAATDPRLTAKALCNGTSNDAPAIQQALLLAQRLGGGVVQLPAGTCRISSSLQLFSKVVLQGGGKNQTFLHYDVDTPVYAANLDLSGIRQLSFINLGAASIAPSFRDSRRFFLQSVRFDLKTSRALFFHRMRNAAVLDSDFTHISGIGNHGPAHFGANQGLHFQGNTIAFASGVGGDFDSVSDAFIASNTWILNGDMAADRRILHTVTLNFAERIALVGNELKLVGSPVDMAWNSSEAILTEGGGASRTESFGSVISATEWSLYDPNLVLRLGPYPAGTIPPNLTVAIIAGRGAGQMRTVSAVSNGTVAIDTPWVSVPDGTSRYALMVPGLQYALIKNNLIRNHPRGIWLFSTAARDVAIIGNNLIESGGVLLRAFQSISELQFSPIYGVQVERNEIRNSNNRYLSYLSVLFENIDERSLGISHIGVEIRNNKLTANLVNQTTIYNGISGVEGMMAQMHSHSSTYVKPPNPRILGTSFEGNTCENCNVGIRLGTGSTGTVVDLSVGSGSNSLSWHDRPTVKKAEASEDTVVLAP